MTKTRRVSRSALIAVLLAIPLVLTPSQPAHAAVSATWSPVVDLSEVGGRTFAPQIVAAGDGSLTAAWTRRDSVPNTRMQVSRSTNGGSTWTTPETLSEAGRSAFTAKVAAGSDNTVMAAWVLNDGSDNVIQASRFDGVSWSVPDTISVPGEPASSVEITAGPGGTYAAIWHRFDGTVNVVQVSHFDGAAWGAPLNLSDTGGRSDLPDIASSGTEMVAVWQRFEGVGVLSIQSSRFDGTTWGAPEYLSAVSGVASSPRVAATVGGTFAATWFLGGPNIAQARVLSDGLWGATENLSDGSSNAQYPQLTANGEDFIAVWQDTLAPIRTMVSTYDGTGWDTPVLISNPVRASRQPQVTAGAGGSAAAVWLENDGSHNIIVASNFDGIDWSSPVALSAAGQNADTTSVVSLPDGTFAAIWQRSNGTHQIAQSAFTMSAPIITSPAPTVATVGSAYSFQVTTSGNPPPTFTVTAGSLPAGLSLSPAGLITGTPTSTDSATFTITAGNAMAPASSATYTMTPLLAPTITSPAPPAGTVGQAYTFQVTADGNPAPTFAVTTGALPPGLTMTTTGLISGTPTVAGDATFTITAANGVSPDDNALYTLAVAAAPSIPPVPGAGSGSGPGSGGGTGPSSSGSTANLPVSGTDPMPFVGSTLILLAIGGTLLLLSRVSARRSDHVEETGGRLRRERN